MHLSIHIERTGGTSLQAEYEKLYGANHVLVYSVLAGKLLRISDIPISPSNETLSKAKVFVERTVILKTFYRLYLSIIDKSQDVLPWIELDEIPEDAAVIHGHFTPELFAELLPTSFTTVVLREPLARMISQYRHWQRAGDNMGFRVEIPDTNGMTFEKYAFRDELINFQTRALGSMSLEEFDLVGVTSKLDKFVARLKGKPTLEDYKIAHVNYMGNKPDYEELGITPKMIERFKEANAEDYKNYQKAMELAG